MYPYSYQLLTLCLLLLSGAMLQAQESFSLEEAIQYAVENSLAMKQTEYDVADAEAQIQEYKAIGLPQVNGSASYQYFLAIPTQILPDFISPSVDQQLLAYNLIDPSQLPPGYAGGFPAQFGTKNSLNAGIEMNTLLFDGSYLVGLKAVKLSRELAQRQKGMTRRDVEVNVLKSYLAVLQAEKNQQIIRDNITTLQKTLDETSIIYENGFTEKLDVERLQLSLDNLNRDLERVVQIAELAKNILKFQMQYPLDQDITLSEDFDLLVDQSQVEDVVSPLNYDLRPEYQLLNTTSDLYTLNIDRYKKGYYPSLRGFASYSTILQRNSLFESNEPGWFPTSVVGLSMNVPIFDGFDKRSKIQRAQIQLDKNEVQKEQFQQVMQLEVRNAQIALSNAKASLVNTERSLDLANKILETTKIKFREGVGSSLEVVQAERELYLAQANHTNAQYDLIVASKDLNIALGNQ